MMKSMSMSATCSTTKERGRRTGEPRILLLFPAATLNTALSTTVPCRMTRFGAFAPPQILAGRSLSQNGFGVRTHCTMRSAQSQLHVTAVQIFFLKFTN
eukprot:4899967-Lingulodinium_polyedra.AAC.1